MQMRKEESLRVERAEKVGEGSRGGREVAGAEPRHRSPKSTRS